LTCTQSPEGRGRTTAIEAAAARDAWVFTRAAALGSLPHLNMQWLGDQLTSWDAYDGLASVLPATLSSGLSGLSLVHSDIGGCGLLPCAGAS
jgi:alpha-glucosidase (family GH31 glycosyl hydrolase)